MQIDPNWTQLGLGGTLAYLIVKEVTALAGKFQERKVNGHDSNGSSIASGDRPTEFWQMEIRKALGDVIGANVIPILQQHNDLLQSMVESQAHQIKLMDRLITIQETEMGIRAARAAAGG